MTSGSIYDDLKRRIDERFNQEAVQTNGDEMSLSTFCSILYSALIDYNVKFSVDLNNYKKTLNRKIKFENILGKKNIPFIDGIYPIINENGDRYLDIYLADSPKSGKYAGLACIHSNMSMDSTIVRNFDQVETNNFLNNASAGFITYLNSLEDFSKDNPGLPYEWNISNEMKKQIIDDGFLEAYIDLDKIGEVSVSLSDIKDLDRARTKTRKYGYLYDYIENFEDHYLRRMKVNKSDFNELYQTLYENYLHKQELFKEKEEELTLRRVRR